jgi:16S rRNA processing protein RimM
VLQARWDGRGLFVQLEGIADRDAAAGLRGYEILIDSAELPPVGQGEFYREDLQGFTVRNCEGEVLGTLQHFLEAPAGPLMVVSGERERWLPASPPHLRRVNLAQREIEIDWPADF